MLHETHRCDAAADLLLSSRAAAGGEYSGIRLSFEMCCWAAMTCPASRSTLLLLSSSCDITLCRPQVNADLSHWVVVCERLFDCPAHQRINGSDGDWWPQVLSLVRLCLRITYSSINRLLLNGAQVAQHAHLLHARVAYREGPQVPDPSDGAWANEVAAHERYAHTQIKRF